MNRTPPEVARDLAAAIAAEREARTSIRTAVRQQVDLLRELRAEGVPFTTAAVHLARALGLEPTPRVRRRLAARFRQRARRVTDRHAKQVQVDRNVGAPNLPLGRKEGPMAQLIRKTTTVEEVFEDPENVLDEVEDGDDDEKETPDEEDSPRRSRKSPRAK